jgi:hypothetical protein
MSGIMLNVVGGSFAPSVPTVIGEAFGGGYYAGQIGVSSVATHYLIVGPRSSADTNGLAWKTTGTTTAGTSSEIDGPANSAAMNNASHPAAQFCEGLTIGGFSDWYMPAKNELEICYFNLKGIGAYPANAAGSGVNPNAVPARASSYTAGSPAQTSATIFQAPSGAQRFTATAGAGSSYWSSTQYSATAGTVQSFYYGGAQSSAGKTYTNRSVRAVRRIAV